jgi:RNA polymerase sigma factor (sigma-70 family)
MPRSEPERRSNWSESRSASTEVDALMPAQGIALPPLCLLFAPTCGAVPRMGNLGTMPQAETRQASRDDSSRDDGRPIDTRPDDARRCAWMKAAQAGDQAAYGSLLRDCVGVIEKVARRQGVPVDRLDDVVQDTLLTIHRARQTYDPARSFTIWLRVLAERRAVDLMRKTGRQAVREVHAPLAYERHADESAASPQSAYGGEAAHRLGEAVAALPSRQREAVQLLVLQERSLAETAAATGRSKGSLKVNLHRALKSLRARLGQMG